MHRYLADWYLMTHAVLMGRAVPDESACRIVEGPPFEAVLQIAMAAAYQKFPDPLT